jgi:hypothetical protein
MSNTSNRSNNGVPKDVLSIEVNENYKSGNSQLVGDGSVKHANYYKNYLNSVIQSQLSDSM